ncbi:hypothetical protein [Thalassospira marina]|uniref:hypothetical protein n=1 Tax=Thalassospira marina TaxID=2048283 RepID=UPI0012FF28B4|nr:hypothetical protein [Thalassospira marina]
MLVIVPAFEIALLLLLALIIPVLSIFVTLPEFEITVLSWLSISPLFVSVFPLFPLLMLITDAVEEPVTVVLISTVILPPFQFTHVSLLLSDVSDVIAVQGFGWATACVVMNGVVESASRDAPSNN